MVEQRAPVRVNAAEFAAKYRSKPECFSFLTVKVKAYLPSVDTVTVYFLRDLVSGKAKCKYWSLFTNRFVFLLVVKCSEVKQIYCPQYEGLSIKPM